MASDFVAGLLPERCVARLIRAAAEAANLPEDSVERKTLIERAVLYCEAEAPERYRGRGNGKGIRKDGRGLAGWGGLRDGQVHGPGGGAGDKA